MRSTLKEIAAKANVSISTVSRIINNDQSKPASPETREKVWKIVRELGYVPNLNARTLVKNQSQEEQPLKTKAIGCIFTSTKDTFTDPFFSIIARGVQLEAAKRGYVLGYSFSSCDMTQAALYNNVTSNQVDGAVVLGRFDREFLGFLKTNFPNLVYAGLNCVNSDFDEVICDAYQASMQAVNHLIGLGHRKIGYLGPVPETEADGVINEHRYEGFVRAMTENGLPVRPEWLQGVELTSDASYQRMQQLLQIEDQPTALFCANDTVAIGAMKAAREAGRRIPEELSLIGIDDIEMAAYVTPALTTIRVPKEELGKFAAKILIDRIEGGHGLPVRVNVPFELVVRESCAAPKEG